MTLMICFVLLLHRIKTIGTKRVQKVDDEL